MKRAAVCALLTPLLLLTSGCASDESDLSAYIAEVKQRDGGRVASLPELNMGPLVDSVVGSNPFAPLEPAGARR